MSKDFVFIGVTPKLKGELDKYCNTITDLCICIDPQTNQILAIEEATSQGIKNVSKYEIVSEKPIFLKARVVSQTPIPTEIADFNQEFIYSGKVGNIVKFSYREFYKNLARQAFTQDVQYDLSEGNIIGFKGAKFEIINASNFKLDYKILSPFK